MSELVFGGVTALTPDGPADFVARSLGVLREQQPDAFGRMCGCLEGRHVRLRLAEDVLDLRFHSDDVDLRPTRSVPLSPQRALEPAPSVEVTTDRRAILALVDGTHTLMSAVMADELILRGSVDGLLAFHDGLGFYLHGAVRSLGFPGLLHAFRAAPAATPILRFGSHP